MKRYVKTLLAGLAVGGTVGFASLFWDDREYLLEAVKKKQPDTKAGAERDAYALLEKLVVINKLPFGVNKRVDASGRVTPVLKVPILPTVMEMPSGEIRELSREALAALAKIVAKKYTDAYGYDLIVEAYND